MNRGKIIMQKKASEVAGRDLEDLYLQYMAGHNSEVESSAVAGV
jgi:hypothetical protein